MAARRDPLQTIGEAVRPRPPGGDEPAAYRAPEVHELIRRIERALSSRR